MGPLTPFFPSLTNFPKCPPPPLQTHSASQERATHPPLRGAHKGHHHHPPSRPSRAGGRGQELKGGVRKVLGCSSPRTHTRIYYPLSTSPHPPTPTWLVSARGVGGGAGGPVARPGGRGTGKARGDLLAVQSCGQETQGAGKGEAERAFSVALQNKKCFAKPSFSPADFEVELARRRSEYCAGGEGGLRPPPARSLGAACRSAGGRAPGAGWAIPGRAGARRGSARPRRGRAAAAACSRAAAPRSVLCLFVGRRLPHTRCL